MQSIAAEAGAPSFSTPTRRNSFTSLAAPGTGGSATAEKDGYLNADEDEDEEESSEEEREVAIALAPNIPF